VVLLLLSEFGGSYVPLYEVFEHVDTVVFDRVVVGLALLLGVLEFHQSVRVLVVIQVVDVFVHLDRELEDVVKQSNRGLYFARQLLELVLLFSPPHAD